MAFSNNLKDKLKARLAEVGALKDKSAAAGSAERAASFIPPASGPGPGVKGEASKSKSKSKSKSASKNAEVDRAKLELQYKILTKAAGKFSALPFAVTAKYTGHDHWNLSEAERSELAQAVELVGEKWFPVLFEKYAAELALLFVFGYTAIPRCITEVKLKRKEAAEKKAKVRRSQVPADSDGDFVEVAEGVEGGES